MDKTETFLYALSFLMPKNGYEVFTGERLKQAKTAYQRGMNAPLSEDETLTAYREYAKTLEAQLETSRQEVEKLKKQIAELVFEK
jgi:hypothetical protein